DPDLQLLQASQETLKNFEGFLSAGNKRSEESAARVQKRNAETKPDGTPLHTQESQGRYGAYEYSMWWDGELKLYKQLYRDRLITLRKELLDKVPDAAMPSNDYENPYNGGALAGIRAELDEMINAYKEKLVQDGKLPTNTFRRPVRPVAP